MLKHGLFSKVSHLKSEVYRDSLRRWNLNSEIMLESKRKVQHPEDCTLQVINLKMLDPRRMEFARSLGHTVSRRLRQDQVGSDRRTTLRTAERVPPAKKIPNSHSAWSRVGSCRFRGRLGSGLR